MWKFEIRKPRFCSIHIRTVWTFIKNYILRLQNFTQMCPFQYLNPRTFSYKTAFIKNASKVLFRDGTVAIYFCWNWINLESKSLRPKARISSLLTHERTWNIDIFKIKVIKLSKSSIHIKILASKRTDDIHQMKNFLDYHSVLEWIWIKGSYLSQCDHRVKGDPLKSQNHDELKSSTLGPTNKFFFLSFF